MSELERDLRAIGRDLAVPDAPDLVGAVRARLEPRSGRRRPDRRQLALAFAVVALALLGATLAIPDARSAFLRVLTLGGERIEVVDELPEIPVAEDLESTLGEPVTLAEARVRAGFRLRELEEAPDGVYVGDRGTVWFRYGDADAPRLLVAQTPLLVLDAPAVVKKLTDTGTRVEEVRVNGARGVYLSGEPHFLFLLDANGRVVEASARLAEDVLAWSTAGVAYRLEGDFDLDEALELARELR